MRRFIVIGIARLIGFAGTALAQETCPATIIRALARAGAACADVDRNQACYGNGTVSARFDPSFDGSFALVGERAGTDLMQQLTVGGEGAAEWSVASMQLQASLINTEPGRNVTLLAFGDVTLTNQVPVRPTAPVESTGVLNIRSAPHAVEGETIARYPLRTTVTANGITADGRWLRVQIPDTSEIGWVARDIVTTTGDLSRLNVVDVDTPFLRPFQVFTVVTGRGDAPCAGTPQSGLLLQSPNVEDAVDMTINGVNLQLAGTLFVQAVPGESMTLSQIDGQSFIRAGDGQGWIVAGSSATLPLDLGLNVTDAPPGAVPFDAAALAGLPVNNLNYRVRVPDPLAEADIAAQVAALEAEPVVVADTNLSTARRCIRTTSTRVTLYAGPGTFYEVIRQMDRGTRIWPVLRLTDSDGVSWWQLGSGHWMLAGGGQSEGSCREIPVTEIVAPPRYNTLTMETCAADNGPVRAGQYVIIQFLDGGWETIEEALQAPAIDPGRVTVNEQWLWLDVGNPIEVAEDRFYRMFSAYWYAQAGTYRIVSNRLSYTLVCDITVPLG